MAEVKLKNGYIKIANTLFEQLLIRNFTLKQLRILLLIFRLSYGFNKTEAIVMPFSRFDVTNIYRGDIKRELLKLEKKKVLFCDFCHYKFKINKNYDEWSINFHSSFSDENFIKLKSKQFKNLFANREQISNEKRSEILTNQVSKSLTDLTICSQTTCGVVSRIHMRNGKKLVQYTHRCPKEIQSMLNTGSRKYIIKDIYKYIYIKRIKSKILKSKNILKKIPQKTEPFFNPIIVLFKSEYEKVFKQRCYLNSNQTKKLIEINSDNPDFQENIPELLKRYKKTIFEFKNGTRRASLRWLIEEENWSGVLNGDFEILRNQGEWISDDYYTN